MLAQHFLLHLKTDQIENQFISSIALLHSFGQNCFIEYLLKLLVHHLLAEVTRRPEQMKLNGLRCYHCTEIHLRFYQLMTILPVAFYELSVRISHF